MIRLDPCTQSCILHPFISGYIPLHPFTSDGIPSHPFTSFVDLFLNPLTWLQPSSADSEPKVEKALSLVESRTGRKFGDSANPLLVSVRSGARASMPGEWGEKQDEQGIKWIKKTKVPKSRKPVWLAISTTGSRLEHDTLSIFSGFFFAVEGMMDTVLNLGLNDVTVEALAKKSGDRRFAFDSYRRFVQMYSDVVLGIEINHFEKHLERAKEKRGVKQENLTRVVTILCC